MDAHVQAGARVAGGVFGIGVVGVGCSQWTLVKHQSFACV